MHSRSESHNLVGVNALVRLFLEELTHQLLHHRDTRRATYQHDFADVFDLLASVGQRLLGRLQRAGYQVPDHLLQLGAGQLDL